MSLLKMIQIFFMTAGRVHSRFGARCAVELLFRPFSTKRTREENLYWAKGKPVLFKSGCKGRIFGHGERTVVFVHGWQSHGVKFSHLIDEALNLGYSALVWNGPGHGESPGHRTNLAAFSRTLYSDLTHLNHQYEIVVGYSFGAAAAAYICKIGLLCKGLILISGPSSAYNVFERYWDMIRLSSRSRNIFIELVENEVQMKVDEMSSAHYIQDLPQDILVIHDQSDKVVPVEDALNIKNKRSDIEVVLTNDFGHYRILKSEPVRLKVSNYFKKKFSETTSDARWAK